MLVQEIINEIEKFAPLSYQESYDNCGLLIGSAQEKCTGVLFSLDCTESVINEAIEKNCNLIISHHPLIFSGLKKINGNDFVQRCIIKAIKNNICIYACHTNIDNVLQGVNQKIASKLQLQKLSILLPKSATLKKIITYVPASHHQLVLDALFEAGAGNIGNYSHCSFSLQGTGTFKGNENTHPFIGEKNKLSVENEVRIETIFEDHLQAKIISALLKNHPYEEVAYDIYKLENSNQNIGSGVIGIVENEISEHDFLKLLKNKFQLKYLKHSSFLNRNIRTVALCGGSGKFLMSHAIKAKADVYVTSDLKYHDYFEADNQLLLIDIGHYESEQFTSEIFYSIIQNKFPTFALHLSKINTNPVNYY